MTTRAKTLVILASLSLAIAVCYWCFDSRSRNPSLEDAKGSKVAAPNTSSSAPRTGLTGGDPARRSSEFTAVADNKISAFLTVMASDNAQSQDFYGKIVDQFGKPVFGATVLGTLLWKQGFDIGEKQQHTTQSDENGEFQFVGFRASRLAIVPSKAGYDMDLRGRAYKQPNAENKTAPEARAIFTMWKRKGAEPIVHSKVHAYIACDGTIEQYNLLTGEKVERGNLSVSLKRTPVEINRGKPFDWQATFEIPDAGGMIAINDIYPNEAPAAGYNAKLVIDMPATSKNWSPAFRGSYYFKSGDVYGRMEIRIQADFQPPPTSLNVEVYANPNGSRNLEFDPAKEISP